MDEQTFKQIAQRIKLLVTDVDGVLTDGHLHIGHDGRQLFKTFHARDGVGLIRLQQAGILVAILTGGTSQSVLMRAQELQIEHVILGSHDKLTDLYKLLDKLNISLEETAYIGDDLPDLGPMEHVALPMTVSNGVEPIRACAQRISHLRGGEGGVRELCDQLLTARNRECS